MSAILNPMKDNCSCGLIPAHHPACPYCGEGVAIIPIYYGLQSMEAIELEMAGKLEWGSRFYWENSPCWRCKKCAATFGNC